LQTKIKANQVYIARSLLKLLMKKLEAKRQ